MSRSRSNRRPGLLAGAAAGAVLLFATPSSALFGAVCIPTLPNCMCTFQVPCPVNDPIGTARTALENSELKKVLETLEQIRDPQQALLKAIQGSGSLTVPGFDAIGIDMSKLASGDIAGIVQGGLSGLNLPAGASDLAKQLDSIGIGPDTLAAMAKGELTPSHLIGVARAAGVDFSMLEQVGLTPQAIEELASGNMEPSAMLKIAANFGAQGRVLSSLGIDEDLIQQVASGRADPRLILSIAEKAGLDTGALASVGLDRDAILALANGAGPDVVMGILQKAGFDGSPISDLGLDASTIGRIAAGQLPPEAIQGLMRGTGLDPSAITLPGTFGPISLDGARPRNSTDTIVIPTSSIPGLDAVLAQARGKPEPGTMLDEAAQDRPSTDGASAGGADAAAGTGADDGIGASSEVSADTPAAGQAASSGAAPTASTASASSAMCASDKTLVSVAGAPNTFGTDVAKIDITISTGDVSLQEEADEETAYATTDAHLFAMARSIVTEPIFEPAIEAIAAFEAMMERTNSAQDDLVVNDLIQAHLMTAKAEVASVMTSLASVQAAKRLSSGAVTATPLFPSDSRFEGLMREAIERREVEDTKAADALREVSSDQTRFLQAAREALFHHNLTNDAKQVASGVPLVRETVDTHEALKAMIPPLEEVIKSRLDQLYEGGHETGWERLRTQLTSYAGEYTDPERYGKGAEIAAELSRAATAQRERTSYGERILVRNAYTIGDTDPRRVPPKYSDATGTPAGYDFISSHSGSLSEDYAVVQSSRDGLELANALQVYMELLRRTNYAANLRRGDSEVTMTSRFWSEIVAVAPRCLVGPIPYTPANLEKRPELFDLGASCDHIEWAGGDPGDYMDPSELGGADAAIWMSKISLDRTQVRTGGPAQIRQDMRTALSFADQRRISERFMELGHASSAKHTRAVEEALKRALSDTSFSTKIDFPRQE